MSTPFLSILLDAGTAPVSEVTSTVRALVAQSDPGWELLMAVAPDEQRFDVDEDDPRIRRGGLVDAVGEFVAHVSPGGRLVEHAVAALREAIQGGDEPDEVDVAYTYERFTEHGSLAEVRKPVWSPARTVSRPWTGRLTLLRRERAIAALDDGATTEADLILRLSQRGGNVLRVPEFLHEGPAHVWDDESWAAQVRVVEAHLRRTGTPAVAVPGRVPGASQLDWTLPSDLTVAVVVAVDARRGIAWGVRRRHAVESVRSLLARAGHPVQVVVVHDAGFPGVLTDELRGLAGDDLALVPFGAAYDWPAMANVGVLATEADVVVVLGQECELIGHDFISRLVGPLSDETVGLTGPRVLRSDSTLANAGVAWFNGRLVPAFRGATRESLTDDADLVSLTRESSALSGECLALTRATFDAVGGLNERLPELASIDLSLKVASAGLRALWVADAELYHLADPSTPVSIDRELAELRRRWPSPEVDDHLPHFGARQADLRVAALAD